MTLLESLPQLLQLRPRHFTAIAIVTGSILFLPDRVTNLLGIRDLAENYRQWFGLGFIVSITMLVVHGCEHVLRAKGNRAIDAELKQHTLQRLNRLTEEEKEVLRPYISLQTKTQKFRLDDGVVSGLVACGILQLSASLGNRREGFAHNITETAWDYLNENTHLLTPR